MSVRVDATSYYDYYPSTSHLPGDIWVGLPTFGTLRSSLVSGIVVTPACDLSNRKVETITYLPVIPVYQYLASRAFLPELKRAISGQLQAAGIGKSIDLLDGFQVPADDDLEAIGSLLNEELDRTGIAQKERAALTRGLAGVKFIQAAHSTEVLGSPELLKQLLADRELDQLIRRFITNGRPDTHFLPFDQQKSEWSGVSVHSVALFRYPLSIPLEILDEAQVVAANQWHSARQRLLRTTPCVASFPDRPMKRLRVQPRYLSDLITRFTSMFGRIGSPDFSEETITRFSTEVVS